MYGDGAVSLSKKSKRKHTTLCDDSESESGDTSTNTPATTSDEPWRPEFNRYLRGEDELPENMTLVQWWGVSSWGLSSVFGGNILLT
jgi:hypothetical protein